VCEALPEQFLGAMCVLQKPGNPTERWPAIHFVEIGGIKD